MIKKRILKSRRKKRASRLSWRWHEAVIVDYARLLAWPNVERVELGCKERNGKVSGRMAVKLYVTEKRAAHEVEQRLPKSAQVLVPIGKGLFKRRRIPTDVVWHSPASFCAAPGDFLNPVLGGAMVGVTGVRSGTYACLVTNQTGKTFALTAGHVVQNLRGNVIPGIQVLQPPMTPVVPPGASSLFGRTVSGFFGNTPQGFLDFALLDISQSRPSQTNPLDGLLVQRQVMPSSTVINSRVPATKFGAVTGRTAAAFSAMVQSIVIQGVTITQVLEFKGLPDQPFAVGGDSGALVVSNSPETRGLIIGLLFAIAGPSPDDQGGRAFVMPFERLVGLMPF